MQVGDLVRFTYPFDRASEHGVFLVVKVEANTWVELHSGPMKWPNGTKTLHQKRNLEVVK